MSRGQYWKVRVPTLNLTGWYDQVSQATINNYIGMVEFGPHEIRGQHQLIVGPWRHGNTLPRTVGEIDFGAGAAINYLQIEQRWFDRWLKDIDNGVEREPPVSIFVMGTNRWRAESEWPPTRARERVYYLHGGVGANSRHGDGTLSLLAPGDEAPDSFTYDPENPVPTLGGNVNMHPEACGGPQDQRRIQDREDVLVFTGERLVDDIEVTGRVLVTLYAATTARDTDFTAKLVDLRPDGYAQIVAEGIIRGRYRASFKRQQLLEPGQVYRFTIDLWSISHVFQRDHRIVLEISSSNFPKYDRNPNTGCVFGEDERFVRAQQMVHHDRLHPSCISLPVIS
jgi:putative CocE/NonD family hydrolase